MYRKTFMEVNIDNITSNVKNIIEKYNNYNYYIAMVKSNAYNHGMYIVNDLIKSGINYFATSSLEEAMNIRKYNKDIGILCVEKIELDSIDVAIDNNITLTIHEVDYLKEIIKITNKNIKVHIKIDTGMNRLGVSSKNELNEIVRIINSNKNIYLEGLFTHFATPGTYDKFYDIQVSNFKNITSDLDLSKIPMIHLSSSFIVLSHPKLEFANAIRIGTILYGFDIAPKKLSNSPKNILRKIRNNYLIKKYNISKTYDNVNIELKTALKLKTNIIQIKHIKQGDKVGYGILYEAKKDEIIATIPIGYDDGIGINYINRYVVINNKKYPVIGEISMCMMSILIDESVSINDEVTILGDGITIGQIARLNNTSMHNTLVNIGKNLPKVYIKNNEKVYEEKYVMEGENES